MRHLLHDAATTIVLGLLLASCSSERPRSNPFDPKSAPSLQATGTVSGTAVLSGSASSAGVLVSAAGPSTVTTTTGDDGRFTLSGLAPGSYSLRLTHPSYRLLVRDAEVGIGATVDLGRVVLDQARGSLAGRVVLEDADGGSPAGTVVTATGERESRSAVVGNDGTFVLSDLLLGTYTLAASRLDLSPFCAPSFSVAEEGERREVPDVVVRPVAAIIRVVDASGAVVRFTSDPEVRIEISPPGALGRFAADAESLETQPFQPLGSPIGWTLEGGDGPRTLYVQLQDGCGNPTAVYAAQVVLDRAPPSAEVVIAEGRDFLTSGDGTVPVHFSAWDLHSGVVSMQVTTDGTDPALATSREFVPDLVMALGAADGEKRVRALFRDGAGNVSAEAVDVILKDALPPSLTAPAVSFNGHPPGAELAGLEVELVFGTDPADPPSQMAVAHFSGTEAGPWEPFQPRRPWQFLPGADGPRTVFARFRDAAGNMTEEVSASATVDLSPPQSPVVLVEDDASHTKRSTGVRLQLTVDDAGAGTEVLLSNCADFCQGPACAACCNTLPTWRPREPSVEDWSFAGCADGLVTVFARFRDAAGNESAVAHDSIRLDTTPPQMQDLVVDWSESSPEGAPATNSVSVDVLAFGADQGEGALSVAFLATSGGEPCSALDFSSAAFQPLSPLTTFLLPSGDGVKTVCAQLRDAAGNASLSSNVPCGEQETDCDRIFLDTQSPDAPQVVSQGGLTAQDAFRLVVASGPNDPAPSSGALAFEARGGELLQWTRVTPPCDVPLLRETENRVGVRVVDAAGNASAVSELVVVHDTEPPSPPYLVEGHARGGTLTVRWLGSADTDVDHYRLYYGNFPGIYSGTFAAEGASPVIVPGAQREARLANAADLSTVYVALAAVDRGGLVGPMSNEVALTVHDVEPRLLGFTGGTLHETVAVGSDYLVRTGLGVEVYDLATAGAPERRGGLVSPVAPAEASAGAARMCSAGSLVFLLESDRLEILSRADGRLQSAGWVPFGAPGRYDQVAALERAGAVLVFLAGEQRLALFDVTVPSRPVQLASSEAVGPDFHPQWFAASLLEDGLPVVYSVSPAGGGRDYVQALSFEALDQIPAIAAQHLVDQPVRAFGAHGRTVVYSTHRFQDMKQWIAGLSFEGSALVELCRPVGTPGCAVSTCGGVSGRCEMYDVPTHEPPKMHVVPRWGATGAPALVFAWPEFESGPRVRVVDLSDPTDPRTLLTHEAAEGAGALLSLTATETSIQLAGSVGFHVLDASGAASLLERPLLPRFSFSPGCSGECWPGQPAVAAHDGHVVLAHRSTETGMANVVQVDASEPGAPRVIRADAVDTFRTFGSLHRIGDHVLATSGESWTRSDAALQAFALSDPQGTFSTLGAPQECYGQRIDVEGNLVYAAGQQLCASSGPTRVKAFRYDPAGGLQELVDCTAGPETIEAQAMHKPAGDRGVFVAAGVVGGQSLYRCEADLDAATPSCSCAKRGDLDERPFDMVTRPPFVFYVDGTQLGALKLGESGEATPVGSLSFQHHAYRIVEAGPYLVVLTVGGTYLVDVTRPEQMKLAGTVAEGVVCADVSVEGSLLYCSADGLALFDLATADPPRWAGTVPDLDVNAGFAVRGHLGVGIYTSGSTTFNVYLKGFDLTDAAAPRPLAGAGPTHFVRNHPEAFAVAQTAQSRQLYAIDSSGTELLVYDRAAFPDLRPQDRIPLSDKTNSWGQSVLPFRGHVYAAQGYSLQRVPLTATGVGAASELESLNAPGVRFGFLAGDEATGTLFAAGRQGLGFDTVLVSINPTTFSVLSSTLAGAEMLEPRALALGRCTNLRKPCAVVSDVLGTQAVLFDVENPFSLGRRNRFCAFSNATCVQSEPAPLSQQGQLHITGDSLVLLTSPQGLSVWEIRNDWSFLKRGAVAGDYSALYVDDLARRAFVGRKGGVDVVAFDDPAAPALVHSVNYPALGSPVGFQRDGDVLYVQLSSRQLRAIDLSAGHDQARDAGGYGELFKPTQLEASRWAFYALDGIPSLERGGHVSSFEAAGETSSEGAFAELLQHQYTPPSGVYDFELGPDRLYVCREQNPDEGNVGFEVLQAGTLNERPRVLGSVAEPCDRLAVANEVAWLVALSGTGPYQTTLTAVSLANEQAPQPVASIAGPELTSRTLDAIAHGRVLYLNAGQGGVRLYRWTGTTLEELSHVRGIGSGAVESIAVSLDRLVLSQQPGYVAVYDIADPRRPLPLASVAGAVGTLDLLGPFGYLTQARGGTRVLDLR